MPALKEPLSGATYTVRPDGLVDVENNGLTGVFDADGVHISGELRYANPHMLVWLAGPQLPTTNAPLRQRDYKRAT